VSLRRRGEEIPAWSVLLVGVEIVQHLGFKPRKRLGQHFLTDAHVLDLILAAAELSRDDTVVEIGPGLGILTKVLAESCGKVIAIELDSKLASMLRKRLSSFSNVSIVHADVLKVTPKELLANYLAAPGTVAGYKVVANLPYYITSPVLRHFLEASAKPSIMVVMVQREVGEAIAGISGKMNLLAVRTQLYSKPTIVARVPARSFYPPPKVNSVVLRLDVYDKPPIEIPDVADFLEVVSFGFSSRRKQLRNSLAQALNMPSDEVCLLLARAGVDARRRAETLSLEEWSKVWEVFAPRGKEA
jgi:16S rRNA (adenine1518-N6/adenine1519-N6)-dimethyltransferase